MISRRTSLLSFCSLCCSSTATAKSMPLLLPFIVVFHALPLQFVRIFHSFSLYVNHFLCKLTLIICDWFNEQHTTCSFLFNRRSANCIYYWDWFIIWLAIVIMDHICCYCCQQSDVSNFCFVFNGFAVFLLWITVQCLQLHCKKLLHYKCERLVYVLPKQNDISFDVAVLFNGMLNAINSISCSL